MDRCLYVCTVCMCVFNYSIVPTIHIHFLFAETAANTKRTEEKSEHVPVTTIHGLRIYTELNQVTMGLGLK